MKIRPFILCAVYAALGVSAAQAQTVRLPALKTNIQETTVSGLSAGGHMAVQFHVANSAIVKGAGIIAGGPYFCAKDDQTVATTICSCVGGLLCQPSQAAPMVPSLVQITNQNATQGDLDATSHLNNDRVWLFSGSLDSVVPTPVVSALETYYLNFMPQANIFVKKNIAAEHAMPTDSFGSACHVKDDPYINNCNFDAAGELLKWLHGNLNTRNTGPLGGKLLEFDQSEFLPDPTAHGMSRTGWVYVPAACQQTGSCKVHVAFHGCKQYPGSPFAAGPQGKFGDTFVKNAGYNSWADTNSMVVLYPQAHALVLNTRLNRLNPLGCWDWWGYDDGAYAKKSGRQMAAVKKMLDRLALPQNSPAPSGFCGSAANSAHAAASPSRAYTRFFWWYLAQGSNDFLGFAATQTTLKESPAGSFRKVSACP